MKRYREFVNVENLSLNVVGIPEGLVVSKRIAQDSILGDKP